MCARLKAPRPPSGLWRGFAERPPLRRHWPCRVEFRRVAGHCQSKFYTACSRPRAGWSSTVFAHELPPRLAGFHAENRLYLFALTVPPALLKQIADLADRKGLS